MRRQLISPCDAGAALRVGCVFASHRAETVADGGASPQGNGNWKFYIEAYSTWNNVPVRVLDLGRCEDAMEAETAAARLRADLQPMHNTPDVTADDQHWEQNTPPSGQQTRRSKSPLKRWLSPDRHQAPPVNPQGAASDTQPKKKPWWKPFS